MTIPSRYDLLVIGGGAAGFFGAIHAAQNQPGLRVLLLEKSSKLLSKVKVSGGGRCNVTHHCFEPTPLSKHYPRGQRALKKLFQKFQAKDTVEWFENHGVKLKTEEDGRMFPITDNSQTIIDCFLHETERLKIKIELRQEVTGIEKRGNDFYVICTAQSFIASKVLVATGGYSKPENYRWLSALGHGIVQPIPSLFTFNDASKEFTDLMGVTVPAAEVRIAGSKLSQRGPVLITHWGLSGPAVIKLSAWAAVDLYNRHYTFIALVNWTGQPETEVRSMLMKLKDESSRKQVLTNPLFNLPKRLWEFLCIKSGVESQKIWADLSHKVINRLIELLFACPFHINGKTTFKEEFVTCGGISLNDIDLNSMESKKVPGLYFAGEILDIDGETGGFNFQAAWTTAWVAASAVTMWNE